MWGSGNSLFGSMTLDNHILTSRQLFTLNLLLHHYKQLDISANWQSLSRTLWKICFSLYTQMTLCNLRAVLAIFK